MAKAAILERRMTTGEVEVRSKNNKVTIEGYAAVFGKRSQNLGGFVEVVGRSAFNKTLNEADVRALMNHDPNMVLGRNKAGTLDLSTDNNGLYYRAHPADTSYALDLIKLLERGDVNQSSFSFYKVGDQGDAWGLTEDNFPERTLNELALVDVSPVTYPAYLDATSGLSRSAALEGLAKRSGVQITDLSDPEAIRKAIQGETSSEHEEDEGAAESTPTVDRRALLLAARRAQFARDLERAIRSDMD